MGNQTKRNQAITVKVTPKEKDKLQRIAEERGVNLSEYIREQIEKVSTGEDKALSRKVKPIIRSLQTYMNLKDAEIDVKEQEKNIMEEVKELCALLK